MSVRTSEFFLKDIYKNFHSLELAQHMWINIHEHGKNGSHSVPSCGRHLAGRCDPSPAHGKGDEKTKDTLTAMKKSSRTAQELCQNSPVETLQ